MQFTPDETQQMLRDSARRYVEKQPVLADGAPLGHDEARWTFFGEQGWLAAGLPESAGGLGGTAYDICLIAEELGRGLVREAYVPYAAGSARLLEALARDGEALSGLLWGTERPLLAHSEASARGEPDFVETLAERDGAGFRLTGRKSALLGGPAATAFLVTARIEGEDGLTVFRLDPDRAGMARQDFRTIDNRGASHLTLEQAAVGLDDVVGPPSGATAAIARAVDHALVAACAEAVGAMDAALVLTRDYLNTRKQFGVLIGDFQVLRHKLADMFIEIEQARSIVLRAISALEGSDASARAMLAAAAKARVGRAGLLVGGHAIQLHGGIGVTEEYAIGHYYKRFMAFDLLMGAGNAHLDRFAAMAG